MSRISVEHIARVEGHGGIDVAMDGDRVAEVNLDIFEGSRFFEQLLVGRHFEDVPAIVSRVCAICSAGHTITSQLAIEEALGITVSEQTRLLRELLFLGQMIESHSLHLYCLAVPDYLGYAGAIPLAKDHPEEVRLGLRLKKLGNAIQEIVGGRAIHPVNAVVGGFGRIPEVKALRALQDQLAEALTWRKRVTGLLSSLAVPSYTSASASDAAQTSTSGSVSPAHSRQYAALAPDGGGFGFFGGEVTLAGGLTYDVHDYREVTNELTVSHSHAKHSLHQGRPYMVGSLARLVLHGDRIQGEGRLAMEELDLVTPADNVLLNNPAQAVELVYSLQRAAEIIRELLADGLVCEEPVQPAAEGRGGEGTAATEVPRGTLYHSYAFGSDGRLTKADIITPTAQNLANIEQDIRICAENLKGSPRDELLANFEMIVRAYDPCISCSVHLITLA